MLDSVFNKNRVHTDRSRTVFILIALAGILPSALVLWFASLAIRNERLATTQIEEEAHQVLVNQIKTNLVDGWNALLAETDQRIASLPPAAAFYESVTAVGIDGLVILTPQDHRVAYPGLPDRPSESKAPLVMLSVSALGDSDGRPGGQRKIQIERLDAQLASQAAQLTAAIQHGERGKADRAARTILNNPEFERCVDDNGRHTLSSIELLILEHHSSVQESTFAIALSRLTARLNNYQLDSIPASQRRFLMNRVVTLTAQTSKSATLFPTMSAEFLSAQFVEANHDLVAGAYLSRSTIEGVWQQRLPSGNAIALLSEDRIRKSFEDRLATMDNPLAKLIEIQLPDSGARHSTDVEVPLDASLPGWRMRIVASGAATQDTSLAGIYVTVSIASIGLILVILILIASITLRRLALAQQKNTMVATVSHELKTPVSSIKVLVDTLLQDQTFKPERVREYLDLISRENLRLSQLIENFLSFSRIERTKFKIDKQQLDVAELIREAVATFSRQVDTADRELTVELALDIPAYNGDAWALNRVILNLLDNAHKYSDPPRQIRVSARVEQQELVLSVSDKGIGIRESDLEKIFSQFYQADQRLSRSNEGCGLGLSIVEHIVNLHGGTIGVKSELGEGSTFTIRLPFK